MGQCWSRNRQHPPMMGAQKLHKQPDGTERTTAQEEEEGVAAAAAVVAATEEAEMSTSHLEWLTSPTGTAATADSPLFVEKSSSDKRGNNNSRNNDDTSPFADLGAQHQATTETTTANKKTTTFNRGRSSSRANLRSHRRRRQRRAATLRPSSPSRSPSPPHNNNNSSSSSNFTPLVNNSKQLQSSVIVEEKDPEAPSDEEDFHIEHHVAQKLDRTGRLFANAADLQQLLKLQRPRPTAASINTITTTTMSTTAAPTTNKSTATDGTDAATTAAAATTTTAVSLEPTGRQAVHPAAYSHFQKIKLQVAVAEHEQTRISNCTTIEERFQDVTEQRQLWKEYQEIQQAVGLAQSLPDTTASPRSIEDDDEDDDDDGGDDDDSQTQQEKKKTKKRSLRQFWRRRREKRRAAQQEEQMMNRNNTSQNSSFLFDFSDMPPQDDMVVDIDPLADYTSDGEESSQASLSLLSETSMEQQRRLFVEKARLRSIPMPQIDVMSATTTTEVEEQGAENNNNNNNNNSSGVEQSEKESTAAAAAIEETTAPPTDYGPTHMPPPRRQSDYGPSPTERETRNNNKKQNNVADLCSLTSGGFETMSGVEVLVNHNRRSQNGSGTAAAADEASLVSDLGDDYSVARSLASFRRYQRVNDYGGARNLRSDSAHDQIDPRFAEKLCETKLSDRLDKLEQALQKQKKENIDNEEEPGILTPTKTPVKSNVNSKPSFDKQCISDEALETPALAVGLDHAVVTPETEQAEQMAMTPQVVLDAVLKQRKALESLQAEQEKSSVTPEKEKLPQVVSPAILESSGGVSTFKSSAPDISKDMSKENAKVVKPDPSGIKNFDDEQAPKLKGSSRYQTQQVTDRQSVITKYRTGRSRQSKPVFRSSVQNVDHVLSHLLHTNSDLSDRKEESFSKDLAATASKPPQSLAPSSQSFRVVGLAPPAHPRKKKAESKVPVIGMSTDEFLKYGEELGFPEDEVPGNQTPQSLASKKEKGSGDLDRTEHQRSRESFGGGNLPPIPCESFDEGNQISEDVLKGYSNENATTQIPMVLKISNEDTDPVPIPLNPETTNRLSLAELRGARSDLDTAQNSLLLAEKVEAQVKDVLKKYRSYDSE